MQERRITGAVVTGPTGAVGSALCRRLLDEGATVWAVVVGAIGYFFSSRAYKKRKAAEEAEKNTEQL